jgi:hypothetical protein
MKWRFACAVIFLGTVVVDALSARAKPESL